MTIDLNPYLNFRGNARAAFEFYRSVFGGDLEISSYKDLGMPVGPADEDGVMHGQLRTPFGMLLMGSDIPAEMAYATGEHAFSVSLTGDELETLTGYWNALSEGATIEQPLEQAPWGDRFGALVDRFGVPWIMNISGGSAG